MYTKNYKNILHLIHVVGLIHSRLGAITKKEGPDSIRALTREAIGVTLYRSMMFHT